MSGLRRWRRGGIGWALWGRVGRSGITIAVTAVVVVAAGQVPSRAEQAPSRPSPPKTGELVEKRTAKSRTVRNNDGTLTTTAFLQPIHFKQRSGAWEPIDSTLVPAGKPGFSYRNKANSYTTSFRATAAKDFMHVSVPAGDVAVSLIGAAGGAATAQGTRITYPRVLPATDLRYDIGPSEVKETLVLADRSASSTYRFRLESPDGTPLHAEPADGGGWEVWSAKSDGPLFALEPSWAAEAGPTGDGFPESEPHVSTSVVAATGGLDVTLQVDTAWLYAPERRFPVIVDPTIALQPAPLDASLNPACPTCTADNWRSWLSVGTTATDPWRAAVKFDLADLPGSANLASADLQLFFNDSCILGQCSVAHTVTAHRVTGSWAQGSPSSAFTYEPTALASVSSPTATEFEWLTWNVTQTVKDWVDGVSPNEGVLLRKTDESLNTDGLSLPARRYREPSQGPRLVMTYSGDGVDLLTPTTLHANGAELEWTRYTGASGAPFEKYEVHRSLSATFTPAASTLLATVRDVDVTTFKDTTASPSKAFTYKVVANTSPSNPRRVTLPADGKSTKVLQGPGPVADTFMSRRSTHTSCSNFGRFPKLEVDATSEKVRRVALRFDLRDIPAGDAVDSAVMSLWHPFYVIPSETVNIHRVTADWAEGTGTNACSKDGTTWYDAKPGVPWAAPGGDIDGTAVASNTNVASEQPDWHNFAITPLVSEWLSGAKPNHGVVLKLADETPRNTSFYYWASDHTLTPTIRPKLVLTYTDGSHAKGPDIAVTSPAPATKVRGSAVTLSANVTDDRRVDRVDFIVDGVLNKTEWVYPYTYPWDSNTVANGTHTLTTRAYDDAGNITDSAAVTFTVDNTAPPTVSVSAPTGTGYATAVQADSPRAWWRLNETSGTTAADSASGAHNGTYRGATTKGFPGALANDASTAARFTATADGDDVAVPDNNGIDFGNNDFTSEAWVNTTFNEDRVIMSKHSGVSGTRGWRVTVTDDPGHEGRIRALIDDGSSSKTVYGPTIRVDDGRWHHVAVVFSRNAGVTVYVDGVGATATGTPNGLVNNAEMLRIGDGAAYPTFIGDIDEAAVYPVALSATRVRAHFDAAVVKGSHTLAAAAADDVGVTKVEFYADGVRVGEDATAPYSATFDTLDAATPVHDGARSFTARAYDTSDQVTTSAEVVRTVANGGYSRAKGTFTSTAVPTDVFYDPAAAVQDKAGVDVTVTNKSGGIWPASELKLRYRWVSGDTPAVYTDGTPVALAADLADGASATLRLLVDPPVLAEGVDRAGYQLRFDMYDYAASAWFADKGNKPLDNPVIVNKVVTAGLGLERFYQYEEEPVGIGMDAMTNVASGNMLLNWRPFTSPGRGLSTVVGLTYNSHEKGGSSPVGNSFSLTVSGLTRLGSRLDIHPNNADSIAGRSNKWMQFTDGDGTTFRFDGETVGGLTFWKEPPGVHLYLREFSTTDATKKWALTRPDRVTFFYDAEGYPTGVEDGNGNRLHFTLSAVDPGDDPGGPAKRVTAVTDAAGNTSSPVANRSYNIDYYTKAEVKKARQRGKVQRITDHDGSALDFEYYEDGNLLRLTQRGGAADNAPSVADRSIVFTYTTSAGDGPVIPNAADRVTPDPRTSPQSTRIYSVRDPLGRETTFSYYGPTSGQLRWRLASRTNRAGATTSMSYNLTTRTATIAAPLSRTTSYVSDTEGKVTSITNPKSETTTVLWTADRMVSKVTQPTGKYREFAYNDNGYLTDTWDELRNRTQLEYTNIAVDTNDVSGKWRSGRTIPHISQLAKKTAPKGTATATPTDDFQWEFGYDPPGNLTSASDPENKTTT
ncbi:MAG TPA: DNRLRE domain-containing protein [Mycobacteriales bacterium]|nr:DNRLRE domain-containing protein [Mycobacteriales bacterium]